MKIGIYDPYLDDLGGGEKYMMSIASCLAKKHEVSIFWDDKEDIYQLKKRFSLPLENIKITKNIFSQHSSFIKRILQTKNYDAIIVLSDGSIPFTLSKKLLLHIQQPLGRINASSWKDKLKLKRITKIFYNSTFTSSFNQQRLQGVPSMIIYPPVEIFPKKTKKENSILHVGRFRVKNVAVEDYKKQVVMIKIFKKMVDQGLSNWRFVIAASVKKEDENRFSLLRESAKGYPIEFVINKTNDQLWEYYTKAKIYWHASGFGEDLKNHPEYAEHFGISTVEAMGAGAVPVVFNAGGQKEIITEGETGFLWDSIDECISKTKRVMENETLWKMLSDAAREHAKNFSKETFCQKIYEII